MLESWSKRYSVANCLIAMVITAWVFPMPSLFAVWLPATLSLLAWIGVLLLSIVMVLANNAHVGNMVYLFMSSGMFSAAGWFGLLALGAFCLACFICFSYPILLPFVAILATVRLGLQA